jgi:hypothetical protein
MWIRLGIVALLSLAAHSADAQPTLVPVDAPKATDEAVVVKGWNTNLALTSTLNIVSNSNVIGQVDGTQTQFGLGVLGGADYIDGPHQFTSTLTINEAFTRTPVVNSFVKSSDAAKLEGVYNYFLNEHGGLYARLSLATSFFQSSDVRGGPTSWVDVTNSAAPVMLTQNGTSQHLADGFNPLTISESVGAFADPVRRKDANVSLRAGIGGRSTFANGVFVNQDVASTPEVELVHLSDVEQLGVELYAGIGGALESDKLNYKAGVSALFPFVNNDTADRSAFKLTRLAATVNATYTLSSWLSAVYSLAVTRDPQLFPLGKDQIQIQNTLLLTFNLNLVKKKDAPKPKTKEQIQLEDAIKRAEDAEKRAAEDELKLKELGTSPPPTTPDAPTTTTPPPPGTPPPPPPTKDAPPATP